MPGTRLRALTIGRMIQTGECHGRALAELEKFEPGTCPIPEAGTDDQAFLEAEFLETIGRRRKDRWRFGMLPFAISAVTPRPDELVVHVPKEFLPDIVREIMPRWAVEEQSAENDGESAAGAVHQLGGIPGMRARFQRGRIMMSRPGFGGRICIPAPADRWRKAVLIASAGSRDEGATHLPWLTHPGEWHPDEARYVDSWPGYFDVGGERNSYFASQILRRLPGLCPPPRAYHDLWVNHWNGGYSIQFEWAFGASHKAILDRLLDPVFGIAAQIALQQGQSLDDCYTGTTYRVMVQCVRQPANEIALRRAVWTKDPEDGKVGLSFGQRYRTLREKLEEEYDY